MHSMARIVTLTPFVGTEGGIDMVFPNSPAVWPISCFVNDSNNPSLLNEQHQHLWPEFWR